MVMYTHQFGPRSGGLTVLVSDRQMYPVWKRGGALGDLWVKAEVEIKADLPFQVSYSSHMLVQMFKSFVFWCKMNNKMFAFDIPTDRDHGSNQGLCVRRYRCWQHRVVAWVSVVTRYDCNLTFAKIINFSSMTNLYHILLFSSKPLPGSPPQTSKAPVHWWSK